MINWIIGGLIIGVTLYIVIKSVIRLYKGEDVCKCSGCGGRDCCSKNIRKGKQ